MSIEGNKVNVSRGHLDSDLEAHTTSDIVSKCLNEGIQQSIPKERLKAGQTYRLQFYAQDNDSNGRGALSIRINGGYFNNIGEWLESSKDSKNGYWGNKYSIMQEDRWINFNNLDKAYSDAAEDSAGDMSPGGLDNIWRKFTFVFTLPKGKELLSDLVLDFSSRGVNDSYIYLDLVELLEHTHLSIIDNTSFISTSNYINNTGVRDLIGYDSVQKKLRVCKGIFQGESLDNSFTDDIELSPFADSNITSLEGTGSMVANNRELHIGFGSGLHDSAPQWLGYINHKAFGEDLTGQIYQDEDTVHSYDSEGIHTLSKVTVCGEYERLTAYYNDSGSTQADGDALAGLTDDTLRIYHNSHGLTAGDNIVVNEWMDAANESIFKGVWVVTDVSIANSFLCKRQTSVDAAVVHDGSDDHTTAKLLNYRPYFYYGIKDGDNAIYRIWPDNHINANATDIDEVQYIRGKVERSLPLTIATKSICTYHNKGPSTGDLGGGMVYVLSSHTDEIQVIDVNKPYNEWTTSKLSEICTIDMRWKAFWKSNTGYTPYGGNREPADVKYAGRLSDIIETRGPTSDTSNLFNPNYTAYTQITLAMLDTRLWIQCSPSKSSNFSEGDRFLFCGVTTHDNTYTPSSNTLDFGDRTPPTTVILGVDTRWHKYPSHKFIAGPGVRADGSGSDYTHLPTIEKSKDYKPYSYFYHYKDRKHSLSRDKLERISVYRKHGSDSRLNSGFLQAQRADKPYVNYGYNVGWDATDGMPSIKVAKYGLFQMADNDGDGIIDGTGVVVPNDETITDVTRKIGPYGRLGHRLSSHVVGVIGGSDRQWVRHWGRQHGRINMSKDDYFVSNHGDGPTEDSPENMKVSKCVFVCADMDFGDNQPNQHYTFTGVDSVDSGKNINLTISGDVNYNLFGIEVGDTVHLSNNKYPGIQGKVSVSSSGSAHGMTNGQYVTMGGSIGGTSGLNRVNFVITDTGAGGLATGNALSSGTDIGSGTLSAVAGITSGIAVGLPITGGSPTQGDFLTQLRQAVISKFGLTGTIDGNDLIWTKPYNKVMSNQITENVSNLSAKHFYDSSTTATVALVDKASNKLKLTIPYTTMIDPTSSSYRNVTSGYVYPHAIHKTLGLHGGGIETSEKMFHFVYDEENAENGDIYTEGGGSGPY